VGWEEVGDLRDYNSFTEFKEAFRKECGHWHNNWKPTITRKAKELWTLLELEPGDKVIANKGISEVRGIGTVCEPGYKWRPDAPCSHTVKVEWDTSCRGRIEPQDWHQTVEPVSAALYESITKTPLPKNWAVITPRDLEVERKRVEISVADRQGQQAFKNRLFEVYGHNCAISGCDVADVLVAAHIHPHTGPKSNDPGNGILLRADIHALFDKRLIAIKPNTLTVVVRPSLEKTEYWRFNGKHLRLAKHATSRLSVPMLSYKFRDYKAF
jgi:hypothetical protein